MKTARFVFLAVVAASMIASPLTLSAADGAALFKAKCSPCHGAQGEGKPAMKAPALKGTSVSEDQIATMLRKGDAAKKAPHSAPFKAISEDDAKAIAAFVKTLK